MLETVDRQCLLDIAKHSIAYGLSHACPAPVQLGDYAETLREPGASFVTLKKSGELRGCVGTLEPYQPLIEDVSYHAFSAAFRDTRFSPVSVQEVVLLEIHISVLSLPEDIPCASEAELMQLLRTDIDGLVLQEGTHRATFLPAMWQTLPDKEDFVQQLKIKAGLSADYWSETMQCFRYQVQEFGDR
ncbi:MAG TPA: AMMECR1 domain-containing protein [Gammaproteobacteria bacterium]|nr:AMMECR1 domain-containing protein [Gammaproteobacteria bacterium]